MNYIFKKSVSRKESRIDFFFQGAPKSVKLLTHLGIGNNSWSFQNSNSLKNWWWEIFTYPISTFRCRNCRSSESDYFSSLNFIQSSGRTCKTLIKVWKMFLCEFRRLRHDIFSDVSSSRLSHAMLWFYSRNFLTSCYLTAPSWDKINKVQEKKNNKQTKEIRIKISNSNGRRLRIFAGFSSEQSIPIFKSSIKKTSRFYQKLFRVNFHPDKIYDLNKQ